MRRQYTASVTFESLTAAPETARMPVEAASHGKAASRAVQAAMKQYPGRRPSSIVVLLQLDGPTEGGTVTR